MARGKLSKIFLVVFLLPFYASSANGFGTYNPATEEEEVIFIPVEKEKSMGKNIDEQVRKKFDLPVDPLVQKRIEEIGKRLAGGTDRRDIVYHFGVLNHEEDDYYNAFAAPGGYIYIFDDLVEVMKDDDKIAAVLAHEMGHVEARHSVKRLQGALGITALMILGSQMNAEEGTRARLNNAIGQLMAVYSRHDEWEADELSVRYLKRAGYDPHGAIQALEELKGLRKRGPVRKYMFYKSHPYLSSRIAHLNELVKGYADFDSYIN